MNESWYDALIMPGLLTMAAAAFWFLGVLAESKGGNAWWKWFAVPILILGIFAGWGDFKETLDPFYSRLFRGERKKEVAHYMAIGLPIFGLLFIAGWQIWAKVSKKRPAPEGPLSSSEAS